MPLSIKLFINTRLGYIQSVEVKLYMTISFDDGGHWKSSKHISGWFNGES